MNPADTIKTAILDEIDWGAVYRRLKVFAFRIAREMPGVFDGISADDLVGETIADFLADPDALGWNPTTEDNLTRFLCGVLKNKFMTHKRRSRNREGVADNRPVPVPVADPPTKDMMTERIKAAAKGKRDLEELVEASQDIDDGGDINQQLSERLNTTAQDVINRRRRLRRSLKKAWPGRDCAMKPRITP
jgi:DNA-directed RNA polymerase specialized sigma24 family protein